GLGDLGGVLGRLADRRRVLGGGAAGGDGGFGLVDGLGHRRGVVGGRGGLADGGAVLGRVRRLHRVGGGGGGVARRRLEQLDLLRVALRGRLDRRAALGHRRLVER